MARPRRSLRPLDHEASDRATAGDNVRTGTALSWTPVSLDPGLPPYLALLQALDRDVQGGVLPAGTRLPPHRALATHLGLSLSTVTKAYREANIRGVVTGRVGQGTFVARRSAHRTPTSADNLVHFEVNVSPDVGQRRVLQTAIAEVVRSGSADRLFTYDAHQGLPEHRAILAEWISTPGFRPSPGLLLATNGAQHGLDIAVRIACQAGSTILVEELTYVGFKALATLNGYQLSPVAMDAHGLIPEALDQALRTTGSRLVYAMPTLHSPTGRTMPRARRQQIADIIALHDATLIEDDVYGFLLEPRQEPIAGLIPERTIYLASLSKVFELGFRAGIMVVPPGLLSNALLAMRAGAWSATPLLFELGCDLIRTGQLDGVLVRLREEARRRAAVFLRIVPQQKLPHEGLLCGYHVWLELAAGCSAEDVFYKARERGVLVTPPGSASVAGAPEAGIRLCLGASSGPDLERGLLALQQILERPDEAFLNVV